MLENLSKFPAVIASQPLVQLCTSERESCNSITVFRSKAAPSLLLTTQLCVTSCNSHLCLLSSECTHHLAVWQLPGPAVMYCDLRALLLITCEGIIIIIIVFFLSPARSNFTDEAASAKRKWCHCSASLQGNVQVKGARTSSQEGGTRLQDGVR